MLLLSKKSRSRLDPSLPLTKIFFFIPQQYLYILHIIRLLGELGSRPERSDQGSKEFITYSFNMYNVQTPTNNYSFLFAANVGKYVFLIIDFSVLCFHYPDCLETNKVIFQIPGFNVTNIYIGNFQFSEVIVFFYTFYICSPLSISTPYLISFFREFSKLWSYLLLK